jgi:hypothetical protein
VPDGWQLSSGQTAPVQVVIDDHPVGNMDFGQVYVGSVWSNPLRALDVNDDLAITPGDALVVINYINANPGVVQLPTVSTPPPAYIDTNGDYRVTPADVLLVINYLNALSPGHQEAESAPAVVPVPSPPPGVGEGESRPLTPLLSGNRPARSPSSIATSSETAATNSLWINMLNPHLGLLGLGVNKREPQPQLSWELFASADLLTFVGSSFPALDGSFLRGITAVEPLRHV